MEKRTRIVFGVNDFLVGGMQRQLAEQLKRYDMSRFDISVVTLFDFPGQQTLYDAIPEGVLVHRLEFRGWWDLGSWLRLYGLLKRLSPEIVVSSLFFSNTVFRVLKPLLGYASIAREHNTYVDKSYIEKGIDRLLAPLSYRIVAVSSTVADFTARQERIPRVRFEVIYNGIDTTAARARLAALSPKEATKERFGFMPADRILVAVSRLMPQKNLSLLIRGVARFRAMHPEYHLAIVSDGPLRAELEAEAEALDAGATFFGYQADVWSFYQIADALVSTSAIEGLSNAMLEALAAGVPIVATKTAGTDELVEEGVNGYFIQESSEDAVVAALEALNGSDATAFAASAQATAERFSIQNTVAAYEALFAECATQAV